MKIETHQFGTVEFTEEHIIKFASGLFGFENLDEYLLIKVDENAFYWLNSIKVPEIAFPLVGIRLIDETYAEEKNCEAFGIVTLNKDPLKITVNLKAPVYINQDEKTGFQKIVESEKYPVNYNLFKE